MSKMDNPNPIVNLTLPSVNMSPKKSPNLSHTPYKSTLSSKLPKIYQSQTKSYQSLEPMQKYNVSGNYHRSPKTIKKTAYSILLSKPPTWMPSGSSLSTSNHTNINQKIMTQLKYKNGSIY